VGEVGICPIVLVGYERKRHIYGLQQLFGKGIDYVYLVYDNVHEEYREIGEKNAKELERLLREFLGDKVESVGCDPVNFESVIKVLTYIYKRNPKSKLYIDITHFAKEAYIAVITFSILFGATPYYVSPKEHRPITTRIEETFKIVEEDEEVFKKFREVVSKDLSSEEELRQAFLELLSCIREKYEDYVIMEHARRMPGSWVFVPLGREERLIELAPVHEQILSTIYELERSGKEGSIPVAELIEKLDEKARGGGVEGLKREETQSDRAFRSMVNYRLQQLRSWGFVELEVIGSRRGSKVSLTKLGRGYAMGLEYFEKRAREGK
jgi:hypothetical protein